MQLVDIILIAQQVVTPADGKGYQMRFSGPRVTKLWADDDLLPTE
jgi:hypothetical protein